MPTQPSGLPPGAPNTERSITQTIFRQYSTVPHQVTGRAYNRQSQTHQNKHSRRKQQRSRNNRIVDHRAASNTTNSRRAASISAEHKQEFQPVHKVWLALQPSQEWREHQAKLRQKSSQITTTDVNWHNNKSKAIFQAQQSQTFASCKHCMMISSKESLVDASFQSQCFAYHSHLMIAM